MRFTATSYNTVRRSVIQLHVPHGATWKVRGIASKLSSIHWRIWNPSATSCMWRTKVCHVTNYDGLVCIANTQETRYVLENSEVFMHAPCTPRFLVQTSHIISLRKVRVWPHEKPPVHTKGRIQAASFMLFRQKVKKNLNRKSSDIIGFQSP
jgi:hypothetical protein